MTQVVLKNHKNSKLRSDAAAAFNRAEADHGVFVVNSAARTEAAQQALIDRWDRGGPQNRPPYLYAPARPAATSNHVKDGGIAIDIGDWRRFAAVAAQYGFSHPYPGGDPVHFEFTGAPAPAVSSKTKSRQKFLNSIGFTLVVDGIEGPLTKEAYKQYQMKLRAYGYTGAIDGKWGTGTQAAHVKYVAAHTKPTKPTSSGLPKNPPTGKNAYLYIQRALNRFGYNLVEDNKWGTKSSNALAHFQRNHGLVADRRVGPATWKKLTA